MYQVKLTSYPNGENRLVLSKLKGSKLDGNFISVGSSPAPSEHEQSEPDPSAPPLTLALNSTATDGISKERRNVGNFTLDARRKLLRAGGALGRFDPVPSHCLFLTGTLPGSTEASYRAIAAYSSEVVHRLKKWLHERFKEFQYSFYCWELQKRGALHLHYLLYCPCNEARQRIIAEFKSFWISVLLSVSEKSGVDLFARSCGGTHRGDYSVIQAYAQECYSSVAAYMAKYVGKQAGKGDSQYFPSRWTGVSRPLSGLIKEYTEEVKTVTPSYTQARNKFVTAREELTDTGAVHYTYAHKVGVGDTHIGYYKGNEDLQQCQYNRASEIVNLRQ